MYFDKMSSVKHIFILSLLMFLACNKSKERFDVEVIGHAGAGLDVDRVPYPGNTQESIDYAKNLGAKHIEIDIKLSADHKWMLFHDDFMDFHTNTTGCISQYTKDQLLNFHYHGYPNIPIYALNDINVQGFETVFLDLRHYDPCDNYIFIDTALLFPDIATFVASNPGLRVSVITTRLSLLPHFYDYGMEVVFETQSYDQILAVHSQYPYAGYAIRNRNISVSEVSTLRNMGISVIIYDMRSYEGNISAMRKNPNFVMTDALAGALILTNK